MQLIFWNFINTAAYHTAPNDFSSPSTHELHDLTKAAFLQALLDAWP